MYFRERWIRLRLFSRGRAGWPYGAGDGIRTRDINLGKVALYQLSYSRLWETSIVTCENAGCQTPS